MLSKALVSYNAHKLLHHNRPQAYFRRYSVATLAEIWAQDTRYIQQANLADPSCLQVDLQCSVYLNSSTIISSPLSNTILPEGHHRPPSRDLTTRPPSTRKHPGHTQCLLTLHNHPSMVRVRKLAEEPWTQESWTHQQLSTAQLVQMMEEMMFLSKFELNGVNYLRVQGTAMDTGMASPCANLFMAELCRRTCSTGQQQNRAYGGDTLMMSLQSGTMAKYTTDTSPTINK